MVELRNEIGTRGPRVIAQLTRHNHHKVQISGKEFSENASQSNQRLVNGVREFLTIRST